MKRLPAKPSALIRLALSDLKKVERDKRYVVDMGKWHESDYCGEKCAVCLAGSVIAKHGKARHGDFIAPANYRSAIRHKLEALDKFRTGNFQGAFALLGLPLPEGVPQRIRVPGYRGTGKVFRKAMLRMARMLAKAGA